MYIFLAFLLLFCSIVVGSTSVNAKSTSTWHLNDPGEVTSSNNVFKLGFFRPAGSTNRYVGIWYNIGSDALEVVWVANKDNPLEDSSGVLRLSEGGDLQVLDGQNKLLWSSNSRSDNVSSSLIVQLQDTGNLVLSSSVGGGIVWQSFDHPTDVLLPLMRNGVYDSATKRQEFVRSWKSPSDPSTGRFSIGMALSRSPSEGYVWDEHRRPYWRTGPWNRNSYIGLPQMFYWDNGFNLENDDRGLPTMKFSSQDPAAMTHYVLTYDGMVQHKEWNKSTHKWDIMWKSIDSECDVYGKCGPFGRCNPRRSPICKCLDGFKPTNSKEWRNGNWTSGCSRRTPLLCGFTGSNADGFLRLKNVKVPDLAASLDTTDEGDCRWQCHQQCSCLAYAYYLGIGCMIWNETLIDIQEFNVTAVDLFVRVAHSELPGKTITQNAIVAVVTITGTITFAVVAFLFWRMTSPRRGKGAYSEDKPLLNRMLGLHEDSKIEVKDLPLFEFERLAAATNNFCESNKLGQGGFGPVFKEKLKDGQEIAVKRLSKASGQGLQEFANEVLVISKLQHRNLVRLLGCCVEADEKILVYEYMPNKSLDALLFDPSLREHLDWKTRFNIIEGICRGLLYLHRDSRLRVVHRDLKAGNILLDEDLNPKISDFGMAKIFGGKEDQGNTLRVVGTYGYMSPEYAMGGRFSEKSDVYSFGVLLLEIVSGGRNTSFKDLEVLSLVGYVWKLWNEGDILSLIDPTISSPSLQGQISRCIHIGLLCVQEFPEDRPTIYAVISMLENESSYLPHPTQPGFLQRKNCSTRPNSGQYCSVNHVSVTTIVGRS